MSAKQQIDVTKLDERVKNALLAILQQIETEDEYFRLQQMRQFKKNNLFWHGFQYLFWSDADQDWRIPTQQEFAEVSGREETRYIFDYVINIFKAHGESIIAALSADIPDVRFGPRDAQDPDDLRAIAAADNAVELIEKWNRAKVLIINALFYLATEGFVASYTYNKKDPSFGTVKIPQYGQQLQQTTPDSLSCPGCGHLEPTTSEEGVAPGTGVTATSDNPEEQQEETPEEDSSTSEDENQEPSQDNQGVNASTPPINDAPSGPADQQGSNVQQMNNSCPQCGQQMETQPGMQEQVPTLIGNRLIPKGREIIEIYGALNVRVSGTITKQADAGYLIHYVDADPAAFKEAFPQVAKEISTDPGQNYERIMRQSSLSMEGYQLNVRLATQKKVWLRNWMLNRLEDTDDDVAAKIRKMCDSGTYFSVIGQALCEMRDESMDDHWTLTKAGPSKGVHADPLLQSIVSPQEIHNNLTNLFVMQVEYGVPSTYADPEVFDFDGQQKQECAPGYIYPASPKPGQSIGDAFYTEKTAVLSKEATALLDYLQNAEQFLSGSFPSIYGGPSTSGSKTLGEYDKSRAFALQRLSLVWYFINDWYGETMHKSLLSFMDHQMEDESITVQSGGNWQTKWIKQADLKGSFDRIQPDVSSDFPVSFAQKRQTLMTLAQLGNPAIESVLFAPENVGFVQSCVGLNELINPTGAQRTKQMREIMLLIQGAPTSGIPGQVKSSVPIEPDIDDNQVHIEVCTNFCVSDAGQDLKEGNAAGYANVLAHLLEHKQAMMPTPVPGAGPAIGPAGPSVAPPGPLGAKVNGAPAPPVAPQGAPPQ